MPLPSFIKSGEDGKTIIGGGNYLRLEVGKPKRVVLLTDINAPAGKEPSGLNSIISYNRYTLWLNEGERGEGQMSPNFVQLGGKSDPGAMLGLEPKFCAMALVAELPPGPITSETELVETIWQMGVGPYRALCSLREAVGDSIKGMVISIKKTGTGKSTRYEVMNTGKTIEIDSELQTNLEDFVGPTTREGIIKLLTEVKQWPPEGGDPYAVTSPAKSKTTKPSAARAAATEPTTAADETDLDLPPSDASDDLEIIEE